MEPVKSIAKEPLDWKSRQRQFERDCSSVLSDLDRQSAIFHHRDGLPHEPFRRLIAESIVKARKPREINPQLAWEDRALNAVRKLHPLLKALVEIPGPDGWDKTQLQRAVKRFCEDLNSIWGLRRACRRKGQAKAVRRGTIITPRQWQSLYLYGIYDLFAHETVRPRSFYSFYLPEMLKLSFHGFRNPGPRALAQQIKLAGGPPRAVHIVGWDVSRYPKYSELVPALQCMPVRFCKSRKGIRVVPVYYPEDFSGDELADEAWAQYFREHSNEESDGPRRILYPPD
jgi:hypothetical protein